MTRRLVWFAIVATAASFAVFVILGNFVTATAQENGPVVIHDWVSPGVHRLNGILVLPLQCDELSVEPRQVSATQYLLVFQTWQDPSINCPQTPTPRAFEAIVFAPSFGVNFTATLDDQPFSIGIIPDIASSTQHL